MIYICLVSCRSDNPIMLLSFLRIRLVASMFSRDQEPSNEAAALM